MKRTIARIRAIFLNDARIQYSGGWNEDAALEMVRLIRELADEVEREAQAAGEGGADT